jgi:nucleoside-diphosphate-sugar epimerase
MAILITGHKGFIGQNMMAALPGAVGHEWGDGHWSLDGIDRVIHLGAISSTACNDWGTAARAEHQLQYRPALHACAARGIPFQFASSAGVYGPNNTTFREMDRPDPRTPYAQSKAFVEHVIMSKTWPIPVQIFRYFNVYGPHEHHKDQPSPLQSLSVTGCSHWADRGL